MRDESSSGASTQQSLNLAESSRHFCLVRVRTAYNDQKHHQNAERIFIYRSIGHYKRRLPAMHFANAFRASTRTR